MSLRSVSLSRTGSAVMAGATAARLFSCSGCHAYNRYAFKKESGRKSTIRYQAQKDLDRDAALAPSRAESSRRAQLPKLPITASARTNIPKSRGGGGSGGGRGGLAGGSLGKKRYMSTAARSDQGSEAANPASESVVTNTLSAEISQTKHAAAAHQPKRPSVSVGPAPRKQKKKGHGADRALEAVLSGVATPQKGDEADLHETAAKSSAKRERLEKGTVSIDSVELEEVKSDREMVIAKLRDPLQRVLFSPGVHWLRDPRTGTWNYPSDFDKIPQPDEFAFHRCPQYIHPSGDKALGALAAQNGCKFVGSSSTLTKSLSQIYFALSGGQGLNFEGLSRAFGEARSDFTAGAEQPAVINIGKMSNGISYIDSDKSYDTDNVLSDFGVVLEKLLTTDKDDFERFLSANPESSVSQEERSAPEAYRYQKAGPLLMRSQLDCQDPRLPGDGVFDIKTRACVPIRHDRANYVANSVYDISKEKGLKQSYERELYELARSGMLKFSLQVRIGAMDGIFLAYHNTQRIFGFQYLPLAEMDAVLFGSTEMGDRAFKLCIGLLNALLEHVSSSFEGPVRVYIQQKGLNCVRAWAQPMEWDDAEGVRPTKQFTLYLDSVVNGASAVRPFDHADDMETWDVKYTIYAENNQGVIDATLLSAQKILMAMNTMYLPEGKTREDMSSGRGGVKWRRATEMVETLRAEARESGAGYVARQQAWKPQPANAWTKM